MKKMITKSNQIDTKKVLIVDLANQKFEIKTFSNLNKYIGGVALGLKLYKIHEEYDPIVFSIGPLNGLFPFVSKTAVVYGNQGNIEDVYLGGSLSSRIKFLGVDSIIIHSISKEPVILDIKENSVSFKPITTDIDDLGLPAKKTTITVTKKQFLLDNYFTTKDNQLTKKSNELNIAGMVITGTKNIDIQNFEKYKSIYNTILEKKSEMTVKSYTNLSCSMCPMGCRKSKEGEVGGNILIHSLVACEFSENIYSDIGIVFSCLHVLGYNYTHEDIENLPKLVEEILK